MRSARLSSALFASTSSIPVDADSPAKLVLFPEMDVDVDVPEITTKLLGHLWTCRTGCHDVCVVAHGRSKRKGAAQSGRRAVHAVTLRPTFEWDQHRQARHRSTQPSPLRQVLCARRRILQPGLTRMNEMDISAEACLDLGNLDAPVVAVRRPVFKPAGHPSDARRSGSAGDPRGSRDLHR